MRIRVAGRALETPKGIRPTQAHVRRSLFDRLGNEILGTRMLELFAGSGAVGIEALCRGAAFVVFVEKWEKGVMAITENLRRLGLSDRARIMKEDAASALRELERKRERFDWCFADPPYDFVDIERCLFGLHRIISPGGIFILERSAREGMPDLVGFEKEDTWRMRDVSLGIYRRVSGQF